MRAALKRVWSFLLAPGTTLACAAVFMVYFAMFPPDGTWWEQHRFGLLFMVIVATLVPRVHVKGWPERSCFRSVGRN